MIGSRDKRIPDGVPMSAGYTPGVPRLGVPALLSSDASLGVTNPGYRPGDTAPRRCPASIARRRELQPARSRATAGAMIGREARTRGFNVLLAGGINLARDPRNGRNFEYFSEDPLLSAVLGAEAVNGIQGEGVISTLKHYTLNCNETNRHWLDAIIDPAAHRESDLLAFQIAIERAQPGSIMSGYNKINGEYAGGNHHLLNDVLKGAWGYQGWVMSDWGATPSGSSRSRGSTRSPASQLDAHDVAGASPSRTAAGGLRGRQAAPGSVSPTWCAASCARCTRSASTRGGRRPRSTWRSTTRSRSRPRGRASCC